MVIGDMIQFEQKRIKDQQYSNQDLAHDEKIDIVYDHKYNENSIKNYIRKKYNINENYISCTKKITKNIFK